MANQFATSQVHHSNPFLYPLFTYQGDPSPANVRFDAALQRFAQQVSLVSNLQTNGKLACEEAYAQLETLWEQLRQSHQQLLRERQSECSDCG